MKFHHYSDSSASYRVRIVLALKNIDLEYNVVDMTSFEQQGDQYAQLNPQRLVPCLALSSGQIIGQSLAIIEYLDRLYPEPAIYPSDNAARAQAHSLCLMLDCETAPLQAKVVQRYLTSEFDFNDEQILTWASKWIHRGFEPLEQYLASRPVQHPFVMGDEPGIVEFFLVPQIRNADRFGVDISKFTALAAINERCLSHPAFEAAHPLKWK